VRVIDTGLDPVDAGLDLRLCLIWILHFAFSFSDWAVLVDLRPAAPATRKCCEITSLLYSGFGRFYCFRPLRRARVMKSLSRTGWGTGSRIP
jgi:hypothetical protein